MREQTGGTQNRECFMGTYSVYRCVSRVYLTLTRLSLSTKVAQPVSVDVTVIAICSFGREKKNNTIVRRLTCTVIRFRYRRANRFGGADKGVRGAGDKNGLRGGEEIVTTVSFQARAMPASAGDAGAPDFPIDFLEWTRTEV